MQKLSPSTEKMVLSVIGYKGRKPTRYMPFRPGMEVNSYWSGGSRDYWYIVNTLSFRSKEIPQNGTPFDKLSLRCDVLATNEVLVCLTSWGSRQLAPVVYTNG